MNDISRLPLEGPQLRTLLLTDLVDSTGLVERLGDTPASELFREHDNLVLKLQQQWRGRLIDRSDGLLLLFERPIDGLGFALDYARGLRDIGQARSLELQARAGLHVGEVLTWKNSDAAVLVGAKPLEVEGLAKPMAARLMTLARPGQILLSAVAESLTHRAARELGERGQNLLWKSYGRWRFKGVPEAQEIYEVGEIGIAPLRAPSNIAKAWRDTPLWRRPAALAAEILLVVGVGVGVWFVTRPQPAIAFAERDWVVVGDLRNLTGEKVLDDSLEQAFRISLEQSRYVNVLSDMKARDTLARMQRKPGTLMDRAVASEIALRDGVRAVILPTVSEVGGRVRFSAEIIDPHTQTTVYAESADGVGVGSTLDSIDKVTVSLRGKLGEALASIEKDSVPLPQVTTKNLDALRAYALGQKAFGSSNYQDAQSYYQRAVQLDDRFALAYLGLLRAYNALNDLSGGLLYLRKAAQLRDYLPARDQLYLEAWIAQVDAPGEVLEKWRRMANLYPDYFPASANAGYASHEQNRFAEGVPFARRAAAAQYEFQALAWDLLGQLELGLGNFAVAEQAFLKAGAPQGSSAAMRLASTLAARGRFSDAERAWSRGDPLASGSFVTVSIYLDQGRQLEARKQLDGLQQTLPPGTARARALLVPTATVEWMEGNEESARETLANAVNASLAAALVSRANAEVFNDMYVALVAAIMAQRMGDSGPATRVLKVLRENSLVDQFAPVADMLAVLEANDLRLAGRSAEAVASLEQIIDGNEPFQSHQALLEAYIVEEKFDEALAQVRWLTKHRGWAYSELGNGWCQQALNVVDTTLAHLQAAEIFVAMNNGEDARKSLQAFDSRWATATLPNHLRVRRAAVVATFN